mgnify:CR=1 FL=1
MLHDFLQAQGLTQTALAKRLGVTSQCVNRWCRGRSIPRPQHAISIMEMSDGEIPLAHWARLARERAAAND